MMSSVVRYSPLLLSMLLVVVLLNGCCGHLESLKIRPGAADVGRVSVSDSIRFNFKVKNCTDHDLTVTLLPECDCIVVDRENLTLPSGKKEKVTASVKIDAIGKFKKYVFIQLDDDREFYTVELSGVAVESK